MADDHLIRDLIGDALESGRTPEEVCIDRPDLVPIVRGRIQHLRAVDREVQALFPVHDGRIERRVLETRVPTDLPQIPGYAIERVVGTGGMGVVYKARHLKLNRPVALKMLLLGKFASKEDLACLLREAESVANLRHPNIIQVHDVGDHDNLPYFTMEYAEGGTLAQRLAGVPQPAHEAAELIALIASAVQAAHEAGIIHRDLKPSNIVLVGDGTPKLADFSLARRIEGAVPLTITGAGGGTPSYMAPEQARGTAGAFCPTVDVYALGALLYELLTGRPPFRAETPAETCRQVLNDEPARPSSLNTRIPRDLETICLKCLSKTPERRYESAAALRNDIRRFLAGEPIHARPSSKAARAAKWIRRHPAFSGMVAATLLTCVTLLSVGLWVLANREALRTSVASDLAEVQRRQIASDWTGARIALEQAKGRLARGGPEDAVRLVRLAQRDLDLVEQLATIRMSRAATLKRRFDRELSWAQYDSAFAAAGFPPVHSDPSGFAAMIRASPIKASLMSALDDWTTCATTLDQFPPLLEAARLADPDPDWRDRARDYRNWQDTSVLTELARTAPIESGSVSLMVIVAGLLSGAGGDAAPFLQRVQSAHAGDFWANFTLAEYLEGPRDIDAVGYYRSALAISPRSVAAMVNLANVLSRRGHFDEAISLYHKALTIDGNVAIIHHNLGVAYFNHSLYEPAETHSREVLRLDPHFPEGSELLGQVLVARGQFDEGIQRLEQSLERPDMSESDRRFVRSSLERARHEQSLCARLADFASGAARPTDDAEALSVAALLLKSQYFSASASAFSDLSDRNAAGFGDPRNGHRYSAACAALLAGSDLDRSNRPIAAMDRTRWRTRALEWLSADLAEWGDLLARGDHEIAAQLRRTMIHWKKDARLAGLRDPDVVAAIPEAERAPVLDLWEEVEALLTRASPF